MARLVINDVEQERQEAAAATEKVDKRLSRAEKLVTKGRKEGRRRRESVSGSAGCAGGC